MFICSFEYLVLIFTFLCINLFMHIFGIDVEILIHFKLPLKFSLICCQPMLVWREVF